MLDFVLSIGAGNWLEIGFAVHALALAIVNLTPTPKDDAWVAKGYRVLEIVAGLLSKKAKQ